MSEPGDGEETPDSSGDVGSVGSVGEEAAKLFGAVSQWARDQGPGQSWSETLDGLADHAAAAVSAVDEQVDTGAAECAYCPICRTVHVVRLASPEVRAHLASAASSLLQAAAGVLSSLPQPGSETGTPGSGSEFEKIDLDGDDS